MPKVDVKKQSTVTNYFTTKPKALLEETIDLEPEKPSIFANVKPVVSLIQLQALCNLRFSQNFVNLL